ENHTSIQLQEEQTEKLELTYLDITEHMIKAEVTLQTILESLKKTLPAIQSIIDIQCILGTNNKYMIKEMSIVDTETWATQHWIFKNLNLKQDNKIRKTNKWLERNHQLSIDYDDIEYEQLGRILNSLKFDCIYTKSEQKKQLLIEYIPHVVLINIEDMGCPRLDQICNDEASPCCIFQKDLNSKHCTFYKVFAIRKLFVNNS
ncbi:Uncharacterized protein FWK35_00032940, partial [Aphis craccivora]